MTAFVREHPQLGYQTPRGVDLRPPVLTTPALHSGCARAVRRQAVRSRGGRRPGRVQLRGPVRACRR